jgi:hypothetical protein
MSEALKKLKTILLISLLFLVVIAFLSLSFQKRSGDELHMTYWIRVNANENPPEKLDTDRFSVRRLEVKSFSLISTIVSVSERADKIGFKEGDLDFYANFRGDKIVGMTHYRTRLNNCNLSLYSPLELELSGDGTLLRGKDLMPFVDPESCVVFPEDHWHQVNFTLRQVQFQD